MRRFIGFASLALGFTAVGSGCSDDTTTGSGGGGSGQGGSQSSTQTSTGGTTTSTSSTSTATGATGGGGSGGGAPVMPIEHVIVIVKENHTFDNYFGTFPGAEGTTSCKLKDGTTFPCPHAPDSTPRDLCHQHSCALTDWNAGAMNGWEDTAGSDENGDKLAWAQYLESDIPNYWAYAKKYTLADHFFADMLGPSFPGHTFFLAAQAGWAIGNPTITMT
ncbi:MAG TPA: alkaline phosphatase family protein, partial [Polyangiaceae bacterium]|nr:alkaline phosphatase family protein [Polyangiaceae bacterium]